MARCPGHRWRWVRDDYTTAVYECELCGRTRGVWKNRTADFERKANVVKLRSRS